MLCVFFCDKNIHIQEYNLSKENESHWVILAHEKSITSGSVNALVSWGVFCPEKQRPALAGPP